MGFLTNAFWVNGLILMKTEQSNNCNNTKMIFSAPLGQSEFERFLTINSKHICIWQYLFKTLLIKLIEEKKFERMNYF